MPNKTKKTNKTPETIPKRGLFRLSKSKDKEKSWKKETKAKKNHFTESGTKKRITSNFSSETIQAKKYLKTNVNENRTIQNLWDAAKAVLRGKFIAIQVYLKKQEKSQINNLNLHLKELEKEE